jgi:hypothetical protein
MEITNRVNWNLQEKWMISKKGKRKITVNNEDYYWSLRTDYDSYPITINLTILSGRSVFCTYRWKENEVPVSITPKLVRKIIDNELEIKESL